MKTNRETTMSARIPVWLDCDPGHDDAFALLLASYSPSIRLLGVSIVHGNDRVENCAKNAQRFLWSCGITGVDVFIGSERPILREPKYCTEIHGTPGKDGVSGMCGFHFPDDEIFKPKSDYEISPEHGILKMKDIIMSHPTKVTVVCTGAQTNLALAIRMFPKIIDQIQKIVFMGGAVGMGNTGISSEFNIEIDPEAAFIVMHSGVPLVMIPLEVTHTILVTPEILEQIRHIRSWKPKEREVGPNKPNSIECQHPHIEYDEIHQRVNAILNLQSPTTTTTAESPKNIDCDTPFSKCCYDLLSFFKQTYSQVFSFVHPPLHDPTTIFYLTHPELFTTIQTWVDVEVSIGSKCTGRTLVDIHNLSKKSPNVTLCTKVNVDGFWNEMLRCIKIADSFSPLNSV